MSSSNLEYGNLNKTLVNMSDFSFDNVYGYEMINITNDLIGKGIDSTLKFRPALKILISMKET